MHALRRGFLYQIFEITTVSMIGSLLVSYMLFRLIGLQRMGDGMKVALFVPMIVAPIVSIIFGRAHRALLRKTLQLERAVRVDGLTRLYNRDSFLQRVIRALAEAEPERLPCMLYVDVDLFKRVNDTFGHRAGDAALREVAACLRGACRASDVVGRVGGEEFAVLLREAGLAGGTRAAERIRASVEAIDFRWEECRIPLTVSIGVADWRDCEDLDVLIEAADRALYVAKEAGRNRVVSRDAVPPSRADGDSLRPQSEQAAARADSALDQIATAA